jgi:hypothetical protein
MKIQVYLVNILVVTGTAAFRPKLFPSFHNESWKQLAGDGHIIAEVTGKRKWRRAKYIHNKLLKITQVFYFIFIIYNGRVFVSYLKGSVE